MRVFMILGGACLRARCWGVAGVRGAVVVVGYRVLAEGYGVESANVADCALTW